jgi:hypothetical protein
MHGGDEGCIKCFVGKPEGKGPLVRPRRRLKANIKMDLQEVEWRLGALSVLIWFRIGTLSGLL